MISSSWDCSRRAWAIILPRIRIAPPITAITQVSISMWKPAKPYSPSSQLLTQGTITALAAALSQVGGSVLRFEPQGRFLTGVARPWLLELEGRSDETTRKDLRAFQTLTHPGHLGAGVADRRGR